RVVGEAARLAERVPEADDAAHVLPVVLPRLNGGVRSSLPGARPRLGEGRRNVRRAGDGRGTSLRLRAGGDGKTTYEHEQPCGTSHGNLLRDVRKLRPRHPSRARRAGTAGGPARTRRGAASRL